MTPAEIAKLRQCKLVTEALAVLEEIEAELAQDPAYAEADRRLREALDAERRHMGRP